MAEVATEAIIDESVVESNIAFANQETFWTVGRHSGRDYNLEGSDGGLWWERLTQEWQRNATPEEIQASAARAKDIQENFRKRR